MIAIDFPSLQSEAICLRTMLALHPSHPKSKLYRNASKAAASARFAMSYNKSALSADFDISPLLHYYSLLQSLKTLMFLRDVDYPIGTSVLQHGISVRRSKKDSYSWAHDYVHVYKDGVMQSYAQLEGQKVHAGSRYIVGHLIASLPHMVSHVELFHDGFTRVYPIVRADGTRIRRVTEATDWYASRKVAARRGKTVSEWTEEFLRAAPARTNQHSDNALHENARNDRNSNSKLVSRGERIGALQYAITAAESLESLNVEFAQLTEPNMGSSVSRGPAAIQHESLSKPTPRGLMLIPDCPDHPWIRQGEDGLFLYDGPPQPDWIIDFVLLYTLSSLCRYNPVEWSDILLWNNESDAYLVRQYLHNYQPFVTRPIGLWSDGTGLH